MCGAVRWCSLAAVAFMLLAHPLALAEGKAKGRGDMPPGWGKGKKGWEGDAPPGIEKKGGCMPPGLSKEEQAKWKDGQPLGWSHGEKEGWEGGELPPGLAKRTPPGWAKWNNENKKRWKEDLKEAKRRVREGTKNLKELTQRDVDSAVLSLEAAARSGVPVRHAGGLVEKAMERGTRG